MGDDDDQKIAESGVEVSSSSTLWETEEPQDKRGISAPARTRISDPRVGIIVDFKADSSYTVQLDGLFDSQSFILT